MQSVSAMNNEAARLIENGEYKEALNTLSKGLALVQTELDSKCEDVEMKVESQNVYSCVDAKEALERRRGITKITTLKKDEDFIYRHPILAVDLPAEEGEYLVSVILVFNMALSHHLTALEGSSRDYTIRLQGALKLYELGFCMQMKGDVQMDMTYALAMVNNCAQIYKVMNLQGKAQKFLKHMLSSLMMMIENGEAESVDELDGFLWNASRLILKQAVAPAA